MSHDMGYAKVIIVVMEVIWGHVFGHGEVKWPPIGLKHWNVEYWSHYLSFDMSLAMVWFFFIFFFYFGPQWRGGGRAQVNRAKKTPDFTEFSKNMDKIMPNGEKKSQKSQQTKSGPPHPTKSVKWYTPFWILLGNTILEIWFEYIESKLNVCIVLYIKNVPGP